MRKITTFLTFSVFLFLASNAYAVSVYINPGVFGGTWSVGGSAYISGPGTVDLVPGQYQLYLNGLGNFFFTVAGDGTVTSLQPESAIGSLNTLTLLTTPITVDPGLFGGQWQIGYAGTNFVSGTGTTDLVPGQQYRLYFNGIGNFFFTVAGDGTVTSLQPESAIGSLNTLTLLTTPITVDPGLFGGQWQVPYTGTGYANGIGTVDLMPGMNYTLYLNSIGSGQFTFNNSCTFTPSQLIIGQVSVTLTCVTNQPPINQPPIAVAGSDQSVHPGGVVGLDGSGSSDPDQNYPLTYQWRFTSKPQASNAVLSDPSAVNPTFTADVWEDYTLELIVTDSLGELSNPDSIQISTHNTAPNADAGPDQAIIQIGTTVQLNGCQSWDDEGDSINYSWSFVSVPIGSSVSISDPSICNSTFIADVHGDYVAQLIVSDPWTSGAPDSITISFDNIKPVADAGNNQSVIQGDPVLLDGSNSSDVNLDPLTFQWSVISNPAGSSAQISDPTLSQTDFVADLPGTYVISLMVNDGFVASDPSNITVVAISFPEATTVKLQDAIDTVNNQIPDAGFKNRNNKKALTNKFLSAAALIETASYQEAHDKLQSDILGKTDGCAKTGAPDKNDWIRTCDSQAKIYPLIIEAIELLEHLI